mgnify:CR=1 FL=1|jgi:predicted dehydrogenase
MKKAIIRFGIIGIGNMGSSHVRNIEALGNAELTAVCDLNPDAFLRIAPATRQKLKFYTDPDLFLAGEEMDAIIIAVPHYAHPDLAIQAMKHGKHIIVEKPIAVHKAEAKRLLQAAADYPHLKKTAMFNQRAMPIHRKLKELIDRGALGRINRVNWIITDWFRSQCYYDSGDWRASWRGEGGGVLLNQCPHQLDLMQWFFGMPVLVRAAAKLGKFHQIEVEDEVNAYMEYGDGGTANFIASTGEIPGTNRLEIAAENGRLVYEDRKLVFHRTEIAVSKYNRTTNRRFGLPDVWECRIPGGSDNPTPHRDIIANFIEAIQKDEPLIAPLEDGINSLELGNAMLYSGLTGRVVRLPLDSARYAAMLERLAAGSSYQKKPVLAAIGDDAGFANSFRG